MDGRRGQSGWIHLVDADGIVCDSKLPAVCGIVAIYTEKVNSSPAHTGHKRRVIIDLELRFSQIDDGHFQTDD